MNWEPVLDPTFSARLCLMLAHSLWQMTLLALVVWGLDRLGRRRSVERSYALHVAALLAGLAALPVTYALVDVTVPPTVAQSERAAESHSTAGAQGADLTLNVPQAPAVVFVTEPPRTNDPAAASVPIAALSTVPATPEGVPDASAAWQTAATWTVGLYALGVLMMLTRLVRGLWYAHRLAVHASPLSDGPAAAQLHALARHWSMRVAPALAVAERVVVPKVVGLLRPTILLPASAVTGLSPDELQMILAHELAHIRRHDLWVNLLQRLAETALFFNPALWYLSRRISTLREYCCDELTCRTMAAAAVGDPPPSGDSRPPLAAESRPAVAGDPRTRYAAALLRVAELSRQSPPPSELTTLAATGRSPSELRRRIAHLFGEPIREPVRLTRGSSVMLIALLTLVLGGPLVWQLDTGPDKAALADDAEQKGRTLQFPEDRPMGVVSIRPAASSDFGVGGNWVQLAPAQGTVMVPEGQHVRLDVSHEASTDLEPLSALPPNAIQVLRLRGTNVTDRELRHIGHLTGLRHLDLEQTKIDGSGFIHLEGLRQLQRLDLSAFSVHREGYGVDDNAMIVIGQFPALEMIDLRLTKVTDLGLARLANCKSLTSVGVAGTPVTDAGLRHLLELPNLRSLSLGVYDEGAKVTDEGMKIVAQMSGLTSLNLSGTPVTNEGIKHLAPLQNLKHLDIDETQITQDGLADLERLQALESVRLSQNVTDIGAKHLSKVSGLKRLSANLDVTDTGVAELAKLPHLEQLMLTDEFVTDASLEHIARMPALKQLWFQRCRVSDRGLAKLRDSQTLEYLLISETDMTTAGLKHLMTLPNLRILTLNLKAEEDPDWQHLKWFSSLEELRLRGPSVRNIDLAAVQELTQLTGLNLELEEPLNDEGIGYLRPLTRMEHMRIETSVVTDEGLAALSDMKQLEYLTLSCLATDEGLQQLAGLRSLRDLQIASPYVTDEGIAALTKRLPSLQRVNQYQYRLHYTDISASPKDSFFRRGEPDERPPKDALEDQPPPPLIVENWLNTDGKSLNLDELRGKVVLVNFWGTRINTTIRYLPDQKQLYEKYHRQGLEVIGVHRTVKGQDLEASVAAQEIPWPVCMDVEGQSVALWHVDGYPGYYLIDHTGTLRYADIFHGHLEHAIKALLAEKAQNAEQDADAQADAAGRFELTVVGPDGRAVPHALVEVRPRPKPGEWTVHEGEFVRHATYGPFMKANAEGKLVFELPEAPFAFLALNITTDGFAPYWAQWNTAEKSMQIPSHFTAQLDAGRSVGGVVVDEQGRPIAGATVHPSIKFKKREGDLEELHVGTRVKTDAAGRWSFLSVPAAMDQLRIEVSHPEFMPLSKSISTKEYALQDGQAARVPLLMTRGVTVRGRVTDDDGEPVAGAVIRTKFVNDLREAVSNDDGFYELVGCPTARTSLVATADGRAPDLKNVQISEAMGPVDFALAPGNTIRVRVSDRTGKPIPRSRIFFQSWRGDAHDDELGTVLEYTDAKGVWEWNEAPSDPVVCSIYAPGHMEIPDVALVARAEEYVFVPPPALVISGKVVDADSKQSIREFRVVPGVRFSNGQMAWLRSDGFDSTDGSYTIKHNGYRDAHLVRIEAAGYQPAVSRDIKADEGNVTIDFALRRGKDVAAIVRSPDGSVAKGAEVALGLENSQIHIRNGEFSSGTYCDRAVTDDEGHFRLPPQEQPFQLIVLHPSGFANLKAEPSDPPATISLEPWARVDGTFHIGNEAAGEIPVTMDSWQSLMDGNIPRSLLVFNEATTAKDGRFAFDRVFPGQWRAGRKVLFNVTQRGSYQTVSHTQFVEVTAGETIDVALGGTGRPIIGQLVPPDDVDIDVDWNFSLVRLEPAAPLEKMPIYATTVNPDGSFRVDDVPPGIYEFGVTLQGPPDDGLAGVGQRIGSFKRTIQVRDLPNEPPDQPLDMGILTLEQVVPAVPAGGAAQKPQEQPNVPAGEAERTHLNVIVARHVLLWEGREVVTWGEVEERIAGLAEPALAHPHFYVTRGAMEAGREAEAQERMGDIGRKFKFDQMSYGSLSLRADFRFDAIKAAADLVPDASLRVAGKVVDQDGAPVAGAEVVLIAPVDESLAYRAYDVYLVEGRIRNPLEETRTRSSETGEFAIYPPKGESYYVLAVHPEHGFALTPDTAFTTNHQVTLLRWGGLIFVSDEPQGHTANLRTHVAESAGRPEVSLTQYWSDLQQPEQIHVFRFTHVPAIYSTTISRSFRGEQGASFSVSDVSVSLLPGETRKIDLGPLSEQQRERLDAIRERSGQRP